MKGVEELVSLFDAYGSVDGYLSCIIAILYFGTVYMLERLGSGTVARPWARGLLADYAYPVSTSPVPNRRGASPFDAHEDCYDFLDWLFAYSWHNKASWYQRAANLSGFLPDSFS